MARSGGRESGLSGFSSARKEKSSKTTKVKEREVVKKSVHRSEQTTASPEGDNIVFAKVKHSDGLSWVSFSKSRKRLKLKKQTKQQHNDNNNNNNNKPLSCKHMSSV